MALQGTPVHAQAKTKILNMERSLELIKIAAEVESYTINDLIAEVERLEKLCKETKELL